MKKLLFLSLMLTLIIGVAFADIKIGVTLPLTGNFSALGQWVKRGIELAQKQKPTVLGEKVIVVYGDTKGEKTVASDVVLNLINKEKVVAILGEILSENSLTISEISEKMKIPQIVLSSSAPDVTKDKTFISSVVPSLQREINGILEFISTKLKAEKMTLLVNSDQKVVDELSGQIQNKFEEKYDGQSQKVYYKTSDKDFSAQISKILSFGSDVVFIPGNYYEVATITKQLKAKGYKGNIVAIDSACVPELIQLGEKYVEGVYVVSHFIPENPSTKVAKSFADVFKKEYGVLPSMYAAVGYDAYMVIMEAIEKAKSKDPVKINAVLQNIDNFEGALGILSMEESGANSRPIFVLQVKDGKFVLNSTIETTKSKK